MSGMYKCEDMACRMPMPEGNVPRRPGIIETNNEMAKVLTELNAVLVELNNTVVSNSAVMPELAEPSSLTDAVEMNACLAKEALDKAVRLKSAI